MELYLVQVRNLFNPQEESALARLTFEQISQGAQEPITTYYSRKVEAFYGAVANPSSESFIYFKNQAIKGIHSAHIRQKVIEAVPDSYESLREHMLRSVAIALEWTQAM